MIVLGVVALLVVGGAVAAALVLAASAGPTLEDAKRECRTAISNEFSRREAAIRGMSSSSIVVSVTDIELQEAREVDSGFEVNGVVRYDMTTTLVPPVHNSLQLTCEATERDGKLTTTVKNRS